MKQQHISATEKLLQLRKRVKGKKPDFRRSESWRYKRLKESWRRPRGLDHKMRRKIKGWPPTVNVGYRGPKAARGLHPSGFKEVLIYNSEQLKEINPKNQAVRIAHTVSKRKRAKILVEARKKKIIILNLKEAVKEEKESVKEEKEEELEEKEEAKTKRLKGKQRKSKKPEEGAKNQ